MFAILVMKVWLKLFQFEENLETDNSEESSNYFQYEKYLGVAAQCPYGSQMLLWKSWFDIFQKRFDMCTKGEFGPGVITVRRLHWCH